MDCRGGGIRLMPEPRAEHLEAADRVMREWLTASPRLLAVLTTAEREGLTTRLGWALQAAAGEAALVGYVQGRDAC